MKRYTKADYEGAAKSLAGTVIILCRTSDCAESWIKNAEDFAAKYDDDSIRLEMELLKAEWERTRAGREKAGECIGCGYGRGHDEACPRRREPQP